MSNWLVSYFRDCFNKVSAKGRWYIDNNNPLVAEEQVRPALPIVRYSTIDEAVAMATALDVGLGACAWSSDWSTRNLRVLPCEIIRGNAGRRDPSRLRTDGFPADCQVEAWRRRGRRESRSTGPRVAASTTGLMVAGANPHVTVASVAAPVPAAPGRIEAWIPKCDPDVDHNPKPVRNGERRPPLSGRTKLGGKGSNRMAGSAILS